MRKKLNIGMELLFRSMNPSIQEDIKKIWKLLQVIEDRRKTEESKLWLIPIIFRRLGLTSYSERLMNLFHKLETHRDNISAKASKALAEDQKKLFFDIENDVEKVDYDLKLRLDNLFSVQSGWFDPFQTQRIIGF